MYGLYYTTNKTVTEGLSLPSSDSEKENLSVEIHRNGMLITVSGFHSNDAVCDFLDKYTGSNNQWEVTW